MYDITHDGDIRYCREYTEGNYISNAMRALYTYEFEGSSSELKVEEGEGAGFEETTLQDLLRRSEIEPEEFVPFLLDSLSLLGR